MIPAPYKIFCDFESILVDIDSPHQADKFGKVPNHHEYIFRQTKTGGQTKYLQHHRICGYAYVVLNSENEIQSHKAYLAVSDDEDVAETFLRDIKELAATLRSRLREKQKQANRTMLNAPEEINDEVIALQKDCYFCSEPLLLTAESRMPADDDPDYQQKYLKWKEKRTVRHHSHQTLQFVALAHNLCNLKAGVNFDIPVYFHNLGGYDGHALIRSFSKVDGNVSIVPCTGEKYMAIKWSKIEKVEKQMFDPRTRTMNKWKEEKEGSWDVCFFDSFKFLAAGLESQAKILAKIGPEAFPTTKTVFESLYPNVGGGISLLYAKQIFPYNFIKSVADFDYVGIPPQEAFYDNLRDEPLSDDLYAFAKQVWETFGIQTMGQWVLLYNLADVTILADAFCKFQKIFQKEFNLDPANFYSLPSSAWNAALKYSKVELSLVTDNSIYQFIEAGIRGGLSCGGNVRYAESNNPYCPNFDPAKERQFICNLDANALYPYAMSKMLPVRGFEWVMPDELERFTPEYIMNLGEMDNVGYFFECDLSFPESTHDKFNAFPPAPARRVVDESEMSPFQKGLMGRLGLSNASLKSPKLIADLTDRKYYVIHYMELKKYIELGVALTKVHRAVKFEQERWMYGFVELCTQKRAAATDAYESFFWKLLINATFGKSCENKRKRSHINVVTSKDSALKLIKKATISDVMIINENMALITMKNVRVKLNSPMYTGVTVLARGKERMFDFYYNCMQRRYGHENVSLLGTDTDSAFMVVKCHDLYEDMKEPEFSSWLDRSDYDPNDPQLGHMYDVTNRKVRGAFKDVTAGNGIITKFCYLKSKLYSYLTTTDYMSLTAKGVQKDFQEKHMHFNQFYQVLFEHTLKTFATCKRFQSVQHNIYTIESTKTGLTSFDNKRYLHSKTESLAYGHYRIRELERENV